VMGLLSHGNDYGRVAGAVNGIRRNPDGKLEGGLFDGKGFVSSLDYFGVAYAGKRVLVLGAGGGASAIAASLAIAGSRAPAEIALAIRATLHTECSSRGAAGDLPERQRLFLG